MQVLQSSPARCQYWDFMSRPSLLWWIAPAGLCARTKSCRLNLWRICPSTLHLLTFANNWTVQLPVPCFERPCRGDWEHWYLRAFGIADIYTVSLIGPGKYMHSARCLYLRSGTKLTFAAFEYRLKKKKVFLFLKHKYNNNQDV